MTVMGDWYGQIRRSEGGNKNMEKTLLSNLYRSEMRGKGSITYKGWKYVYLMWELMTR